VAALRSRVPGRSRLRLVRSRVRFYAGLLRNIASNSQDAVALQALAQFPGQYLPWTAGAMSPTAVATLVNQILLNRRHVIVECGSGVSTVVFARVVRQEGGHIYTIEEDAEWCARVLAWLDRDGTADVVTVIHAPVEGSGEERWYRRAALDEIPAGIDLLVVDGPTAWISGSELARYPALPYFYEKLAPDATIALDDSFRRGERQIIARWRNEFGRDFEARPGSRLAVSHGRDTLYG
jgi:predicted O-methyltransferase YrrM